MANAKSLKLCCASQTASPPFPPTSPTCRASRLTSAYPGKAMAHPLCGLTSLPHSLPSEEPFPTQVQLQGPIFQTPSSAKLSSLNPPWSFIHIFVHPCVSYPLSCGEHSAFLTLSDYLSLKTATYPTIAVSVCIWGRPTLISILYLIAL